MAAPQFKLTYIDGREEVVKMLPKAQVAYEVKEKKSLREEADSLQEVYKLAWYAANTPATFDVWLEELESVDSVDAEGDVEPPLDIEESPISLSAQD